MNVTSLNTYRSFQSLLDMGLSLDAAGEHREAFALLTEAMEKMGAQADRMTLQDAASVFLNLSLLAGRMRRPELGMELLERSRELFARLLGAHRIVGPA
jgi:tetratricopeptide (TPR) repeat protein